MCLLGIAVDIDKLKALGVVRDGVRSVDTRSQTVRSGGFVESFSKAVAETGKGLGRTGTPFIPLPSATQKAEDFEERIMALRTHRQELLASNIANADTPGYKARDVDLSGPMQEALHATAPKLEMASQNGRHLRGSLASNYPTPATQYHVPNQASVDGNTVEMDTERSKFLENSLRHDFAVDDLKGKHDKLLKLYKDMTK